MFQNLTFYTIKFQFISFKLLYLETFQIRSFRGLIFQAFHLINLHHANSYIQQLIAGTVDHIYLSRESLCEPKQLDLDYFTQSQ